MSDALRWRGFRVVAATTACVLGLALASGVGATAWASTQQGLNEQGLNEQGLTERGLTGRAPADAAIIVRVAVEQGGQADAEIARASGSAGSNDASPRSPVLGSLVLLACAGVAVGMRPRRA